MPNTIEEFEKFIVRILYQGEPVGAGFLVSSRHIITCCHVISELGSDITLDFPRLSRDTKKARVKKVYPVIKNPTIEDIEDIAVLELLPDQELPNEATPAIVKTEGVYDHEMLACGFPKEKPVGSWIDGVIKAGCQDGRTQFDQIGNSKFVKKYFSGASVWDKEIKAVVGMVLTKGTDSDGISTGYMTPASTLIKAWPELGSKSEDTSEKKSTVGRFVYKMCNREVQEDAFNKFFDGYKNNITSEQKPPQIYIVPGREDECHNSLVERFQYKKIKQFNTNTFKDSVKPLFEKLPFEFVGDLEARKNRLLRKLFELFDENYQGSYSNSSFRDFCEDKDLKKHRIIILSQDIDTSEWDEDFRELVEWYINDFWAGFNSSEDTPQFLVFLNVVYTAVNKPGMFKALFKRKSTSKEIEKSIADIQGLKQVPSIMLKELHKIKSADVKKWFGDHNINVDEFKRIEMIKKMFKKEEELCMAKVESELKMVVKAASTPEF